MTTLKKYLDLQLQEIWNEMGWSDESFIGILEDGLKELKLTPAITTWVAMYAHEENFEARVSREPATPEEKLEAAQRIEACLEKALQEAKNKREQAERALERSKDQGWQMHTLPGVEVCNLEGRHLTPEMVVPGMSVAIGPIHGCLEHEAGQYRVLREGHLYAISIIADPRDGVMRLWCTAVVNLRSLDRLLNKTDKDE